MNFEKPPILQEEPEAMNKKDIFQKALNDELVKMEKAEIISPEQAEEKRRAAALIETGFSDDSKHDALIFSKAGIAEEKEMIELFKHKNKLPKK